MANNTIHHETQSVVPGACGLIGLVVVMAFIVWLIRFLAHEGRLSDPQRALIVEESGTSTVGAEARSDSDDGIPTRWIRVPRGYRLPQKSKKVNPLAEVVGAFGAANS
ncbi:hypothetical protein N7516_008109 [Penicillium verrucosum]|uniref:uncharacterized protein n=1 Tax=Penicillium verrucosum TaxID=60171 RepID=UPI002545B2D7|nr:uncharacterized protein N7516_008109 [Penicillium verrucosum]KAJ5926336.1 hypothetical protein N7516_008109 [Penicillium verrucosum]